MAAAGSHSGRGTALLKASLLIASLERGEQGTTLVGQAVLTITVAVASIKWVTDITGEMSAASIEESAGVSQMGFSGPVDPMVSQCAFAYRHRSMTRLSSGAKRGEADHRVGIKPHSDPKPGVSTWAV